MVAIMAVVLVFGLQMLPEQERTEASGWEYDDYRQIDGALSASGSLEMVGQYVHARDVGAGTITYGDRTESVEVRPAYLDVYLMCGQSNGICLKWNASEADPRPALGEAYAWMTEGGYYGGYPGDPAIGTFAMRPVINVDGTPATGDKCVPFCAKVSELTGHKVYWISAAFGGRAIGTFNPSGSTTWTFMLNTVSAAMSAIDTDRFIVSERYYLWIQGESDKNLAVDTYKDRFMAMHEGILSGRLGYTFTHCFISLPRSSNATNAVIAQKELAEEHPGTITIATDIADTFTVANGLMSSDDLHYSQLGDNLVGVALGEACGSFLGMQEHREPLAVMVELVPILLVVGTLIMVAGAIILRR